VNQKGGGSCKTATTVSVGRGARRAGAAAPLVIDLDPAGERDPVVSGAPDDPQDLLDAFLNDGRLRGNLVTPTKGPWAWT